jgi:V/A-type H+/Na+-transporting ATPase subunit I
MITPMKKVNLVLLEREREEGLLALRKLGLVHVETEFLSGAEYQELAQTREEISRALNIIPQVKDPPKGKLSVKEAIDLAHRVIEMEERKPTLQTEAGSLAHELERVEAWGDLDPAEVDFLRAKGLSLKFYEVDERSFAALAAPIEGVDLVVLDRQKRSLRLAAVSRKGEWPTMPRAFAEFALPLESTATMRARLAAISAEVAGLGEKLAAAALETESMRRALASLEQEIFFVTVKGSFKADGPVCYVKGFIPADGALALETLARERSWVALIDEPDPEDATPTNVVQNRVTRLIKPVLDFLGVVPGYHEYEISFYFLVFFSFFSAMIFGDGGYGLLMLAACLFFVLRAGRQGKKITDSIKLFLFISVLTILWGTATATWFSIKADQLPAFLVSISIWPISSANPAASKNIQVFCFLLGAFQLSIARIKNIVRDFPNPKFLGQVGSLALIWGMLFLVLNLVVDSKRFPVPPFAVYLVGGGFAANLLLGSYENNIFKSIIEGLKNIIPTFLGSVGVFADIVSYIRLWALGLAGSSLATIINSMAGGLFKPLFMALFGVILLAFGHGLNMTLSVLSVVVHAIRLNVLEFSCNHLGMQWSGIKYEPFRVTYEQDK